MFQDTGSLTQIKYSNSVLYLSISQSLFDLKIMCVLCKTEATLVQSSIAKLVNCTIHVSYYLQLKRWQSFDSAGFKLTHNWHIWLHQHYLQLHMLEHSTDFFKIYYKLIATILCHFKYYIYQKQIMNKNG